ncbi:MAG: hypothetical protein HZB80_06070 [Deltaproteobacteria bacterium]|nr:hypothetical protein [Deltaproteobacteria bacterium]
MREIEGLWRGSTGTVKGKGVGIARGERNKSGSPFFFSYRISQYYDIEFIKQQVRRSVL